MYRSLKDFVVQYQVTFSFLSEFVSTKRPEGEGAECTAAFENALTTITMKSAPECGWIAVIIIVINKHCLVHQKESWAGE